MFRGQDDAVGILIVDAGVVPIRRRALRMGRLIRDLPGAVRRAVAGDSAGGGVHVVDAGFLLVDRH